MTKSKKGKWILQKLSVRWFCRNCHQKGLAAVNFKNKQIETISMPEIVHIIEVTCHTDCKTPDIRLNVHHENPKAIH